VEYCGFSCGWLAEELDGSGLVCRRAYLNLDDFMEGRWFPTCLALETDICA